MLKRKEHGTNAPLPQLVSNFNYIENWLKKARGKINAHHY
jgi:hypothetical protein